MREPNTSNRSSLRHPPEITYDTLANFGDANTSLWQFDNFTNKTGFPAITLDYGTGTNSAITAIVPEPSTFFLASLGLLGLVSFGWRRRRSFG